MSDKDTIYRQAALDAVNAYLGLSAVSRTIQNMTSIQEILENLPSAEPDKDLIHLQKEQAYMQGYEDGRKSRKKGKWIYYDPNGFKCSRCGGYLEIGCGDVKMNFCPNCGADMREGEE